MKQQEIYIAIADRFPASTMNVVPFTDRKKAAEHVIGRIREYMEGKTWNPEHWTGYGKSGEHHIESIDGIEFGLDNAIMYNDRVETSAIFGIAVRSMDDPANAEFGAHESPAEPGEPAVESLASKLWESMDDLDIDECDDTDKAVAYLKSVLPRADIGKTGSTFIQLVYMGMEYRVTLYYLPGGGELQFYNRQSDIVDLEINRDTENPDSLVRMLFDDSPYSEAESLARTLWDGMADPEREVHDDRDAAIACLRAMFPDAEVTVAGADSFYLDCDGEEYYFLLDYDRDENNKLHGGKIIVRDYGNAPEPVTINGNTRDVKGTLEKFFKKAKSAGNSPDSPDSPAEPSLMDRLAKLDAEIKKINAEIKEIKATIKK